MTAEDESYPESEQEPSKIGRGRKTWLVTAGIILLAAGLLAAGFGLARSFESPEQRQAKSSPPPAGPITTAISDETRFIDVTAEAAVSSPAPTAVYLPAGLGDMPVVTSLNVSIGQTLFEGQLVADISGRPLIAADLPFPLYRDIYVGDSGPDVEAVSAVMVRLGYFGSTYSPDTAVNTSFKNAFNQFITDYGYTAAQAAGGGVASGGGAPAPAAPGAGSTPAASEKASSDAPVLVVPRGLFLRLSSSGPVSKLGAERGAVVTDPNEAFLELGGQGAEVTAWVDKTSSEALADGQTGQLLKDGQDTGVEVTITGVEHNRSVNEDTGISGFKVVMSASASVDEYNTEERNLSVSFRAPVAEEGTLMVPQTAVFTEPTGVSLVKAVNADGSFTEVTIELGSCATGWCAFTDESGALESGSRVLVSAGG